MKTVDVIIPTYKRAIFLARAIDSVLNQTYPYVNVIVVDDNTVGDRYRVETQQIMLNYHEDNRVTYLKHEINKNGAAARNTGLRFSKSSYVALLDDDDFFCRDKIENQIKAIEGLDNSWGGVSCYHVRRYKQYAYTTYSINERADGNYCYDFLTGKTSTPSSTLLLRKEIFDVIGYFDESFKRHQDLEFLVRFYRKFKMAISPHYDTYMQIEGFRNYPVAEKAYQIKAKFLNKYRDDIAAFTKEQREEIYKFQWFDIACLYLRERKFKKAKEVFTKEVFKYKKATFKDILRVFFFILSGYVPVFKKLTAILLSKIKYSRFSKKMSC
tara:strand:- start:73346 stop:74323 length:978 start_codon:yes stop_codon:yes gene_type:complete